MCRYVYPCASFDDLGLLKCTGTVEGREKQLGFFAHDPTLLVKNDLFPVLLKDKKRIGNAGCTVGFDEIES